MSLDSTNTSSNINNNEEDSCAICLEILNEGKCCTTDCGHTFHSKCIFRNFKNSFECPLCRNDLVDEDDEDETETDFETSYESDTYESSSINSDREEADENNPAKLRIKQIYDAIKKKGYNELDFISFLLIDNFPAEIKQKKNVFWRCIEMMKEIDKMCEREIAVDYRDTRSYASVVRGESRSEEI